MSASSAQPLDLIPDLIEAAGRSKAWPFEEAKKIVTRLEKVPKSEILFETGYGPSGLPHIGTFGEVVRTSMVRHAFRVLTGDKIRRNCCVSRMTWTVCAKYRTMCRTKNSSRPILVGP